MSKDTDKKWREATDYIKAKANGKERLQVNRVSSMFSCNRVYVGIVIDTYCSKVGTSRYLWVGPNELSEKDYEFLATTARKKQREYNEKRDKRQVNSRASSIPIGTPGKLERAGNGKIDIIGIVITLTANGVNESVIRNIVKMIDVNEVNKIHTQ